MKVHVKLLALFLVICSCIVVSSSAFAMDIEKIERVQVEVPEVQDDTQIDTSKLMYETQPVYGNGIYVQRNYNGRNEPGGAEYDIHVPDRYKTANFTNSPLYIYDENLNCIKSIEFEHYLTGLWFVDGYFYYTIITYGDAYQVQYYKGIHPESMIEITQDDYELGIHRTKLMSGQDYTYKKHRYREESGMITVTRFMDEYLIEKNGDMYPIVRENKYTAVSPINNLSVADRKICVIGIYTNYNHNERQSTAISLDGVSLFGIPQDVDSDALWTDAQYLYLGIRDNENECYRIPIAELTNCIKVKYNGEYLSFATPPTIEDDRTLVPMRFLFEQMGAEVEWDNDTRTATVKKDQDVISFSIDDNIATVNNIEKYMDVPARLIHDKTLIPLRFLSEELGYNVAWDGETRTASINP